MGLFAVNVADEARKGKGALIKAARLRHNDDDDDGDDDNDDNKDGEDDNNNERNGACSVPFFRVFSTGFHCSDCRTPVGSGKDAVI